MNDFSVSTAISVPFLVMVPVVVPAGMDHSLTSVGVAGSRSANWLFKEGDNTADVHLDSLQRKLPAPPFIINADVIPKVRLYDKLSPSFHVVMGPSLSSEARPK